MSNLLYCSILALALAGCSSESKRAKAELATIEKAQGNGREKCAARRKIADAYLHENNVGEYHDAKVHADVECMHADQDPAYADGTEGITADNMDVP